MLFLNMGRARPTHVPDPKALGARLRTLREVEKEHVAAILNETDGNEQMAARILDIPVEDLRALRSH